MKSAIAIATCLLLSAAPLDTARADNCAQKAHQEAGRRGAQILEASQVRSGGGATCRILLLVPGTGGKPPRRVEVRVPSNG